MPFVVACFLSVGCSHLSRTEEPEFSEPSEELRKVYSDNLRSYSFGEPRDCDTSLWAGVAYCAGVPVSLSAYLYPGNKPQRRTKISCWPNDLNADGRPDSRSTISNDGIIGLSMCDSNISNRILEYGIENSGVMGEPPNAFGEVYLKWNVKIVLEGRDTPTFYGEPSEDYQYHIQVLLILWEGRKYGSISTNALARLKGAALAYPDDYLFAAAKECYTGGDQATKLLLKGLNPSSYVRGDEVYPMANWLYAAKLVLTNCHRSNDE